MKKSSMLGKKKLTTEEFKSIENYINEEIDDI